jgi:CBS domain-containing protein
VHDIDDFLSKHEPFADLDAAHLRRIADAVEIEFFARGEQIFEQGQEPAERVRIIRSGAVELVDRGRTLDLLGEGELFGHPSMLAGLPTGFAARAGEDTITYRLPGDILLPLLTRPEGLRFVARSLLARRWRPDASTDASPADPARRPVGAFIREPIVMCDPRTTVRDVAQQMAARGASCALVRIDDSGFGIVTDQDFRVRVVGGDVALDAPVGRAMTAPAFTVGPSRTGIDVMVEMINRGIRHVPVVSDRREVLGVVTDVDLLASDTRTPFMVRRSIARARDIDELVAAASQLRPTIIALHDADVASTHICAIIAAVADGLTRRAIELLAPRAGDLPPFQWLATGSLGRREAFPSSDVDSALVWEGNINASRIRPLAHDVMDVLERCGFPRDHHAATAEHPLFSRSSDAWRHVIARWLDRPDDARLLIVLSVLEDAREVLRSGAVSPAFDALRDARGHPALLRRLRRLALSHRPPTGFLRNIVVEHSGEHRGLLDIKNGGLLPIVDLARYYSLATGSEHGTTPGRLRGAVEADLLSESDATTLEEAFDLFTHLRMEHQVRQLRRNEPLTNFLDPAELNPLMRRYLREAFRAIARVQRRLGLRLPTAS